MRRVATVIGISSVLVGLAGVSTAAVQASSSGQHFKACATKSGTLSLLKGGKCAKHTKKVTLAASGPRGARGPKGERGGTGPAGPGAVTTSVTRQQAAITPGPTVATGIPGVSVKTVCDSDVAKVEVAGAGAYVAQGALNAALSANDGGLAQVEVTGFAARDLGVGGNAVVLALTLSTSSQLIFSVTPGTNSTALLTGQVIVTDTGVGTFTMAISVSSTATGACTATAVVTPTTTAH
jgi:hypothetical protein